MKVITRINGMTPKEYAAKSRERAKTRRPRKRAAKLDTDVIVTPPPRVDANLAEERPPHYAPPDEHIVVPLTEQGHPILKITDFSVSPPPAPEPVATIDEAGPPLPKLNWSTMSTVLE